MPLKKKVKLVAANGSPIDVHGEKTIEFQISGGRRCAMNYLVTGVKKPLASIGTILDGGNRVIFDADGSFIEMKRKDGIFMMEMKVGPEEDEDGAMGTNLGFPRQGRRGITPSGLEPTVTVRRMMQWHSVLEQWSRTMRTWRLRWRPG